MKGRYSSCNNKRTFINNTINVYETLLTNINNIKGKYMMFNDDKIINKIVKNKNYAEYIKILIETKDFVYKEIYENSCYKILYNLEIGYDDTESINVSSFKKFIVPDHFKQCNKDTYRISKLIFKKNQKKQEKQEERIKKSSILLNYYNEQTDEMIIDIIKEIDKELPPPYNADNKQKVNFHDAKHVLHIENEKIEF